MPQTSLCALRELLYDISNLDGDIMEKRCMNENNLNKPEFNMMLMENEVRPFLFQI